MSESSLGHWIVVGLAVALVLGALLTAWAAWRSTPRDRNLGYVSLGLFIVAACCMTFLVQGDLADARSESVKREALRGYGVEVSDYSRPSKYRREYLVTLVDRAGDERRCELIVGRKEADGLAPARIECDGVELPRVG